MQISSHEEAKHCVISAENPIKQKWDAWMVLVLFFVAITLPYRIAFSEKDPLIWQVLNYSVDLTFLTDIVLTFFTTIPDEERGEVITDKKRIARSYLTSWFAVDVISIIPFDVIFQASHRLG
jgi:hypothetical protein